MTTRTNQKQRTRAAIVAAARELIRSGADITMAAVAKDALVSEATAYRYFPDLVSLLDEALVGVRDTAPPAISATGDPIERVAAAADNLLRETLAHQGAVRAIIAATITRPESAGSRPVRRFSLIDQALDGLPKPVVAQLRRDLAVVMSAEALFILTDLCGLPPEEAIASAISTARTLTEAALRAWAEELRSA